MIFQDTGLCLVCSYGPCSTTFGSGNNMNWFCPCYQLFVIKKTLTASMLYSLQSELSNILILYIPVLGFSFYSAKSTSQHGLISHSLFQIGLTGSIFLTVAIAIERYATVCHPFFKVQTYLFNAKLVSRVSISLVKFPNPLHGSW